MRADMEAERGNRSNMWKKVLAAAVSISMVFSAAAFAEGTEGAVAAVILEDAGTEGKIETAEAAAQNDKDTAEEAVQDDADTAEEAIAEDDADTVEDTGMEKDSETPETADTSEDDLIPEELDGKKLPATDEENAEENIDEAQQTVAVEETDETIPSETEKDTEGTKVLDLESDVPETAPCAEPEREAETAIPAEPETEAEAATPAEPETEASPAAQEDFLELFAAELNAAATDTAWQKDFDYTLSGDTIILTAYRGTAAELQIPAEAVIDGKTYCTALAECSETQRIFGNGIKALSFEAGVAVPLDCSWLFAGCKTLEKIDLSGINTAEVKNMSHFFDGCEKLGQFQFGDMFDTVNVEDMSFMFADCSRLSWVDLFGFTTDYVESMASMFAGCSRLKTLKINSFDTGKAADMSSMFSGCVLLEELDLTSFDMQAVTAAEHMLQGTQPKRILSPAELPVGLSVELPDVYLEESTDTEYTSLPGGKRTLVRKSSEAEIGEHEHIYGEPVLSKDGSYDIAAFHCTICGKGYELLVVSEAQACSVKGLRNCETDTVLVPDGIGGKTVVNLGRQAFSGSNIEEISLPETISSIPDGAFRNCEKLQKITIPSGVTLIGSGAFEGCTGLQEIHIPPTVASVQRDAFFGCTRLRELEIRNPHCQIEDNAIGMYYSEVYEKYMPVPDFVIRGYSYTRLEDYARANGIQFSALDIPVSSIEMKQDSIRLEPGDQVQLSVRIKPFNASSTALLWSSDDEQTASVDAAGLVTAHKAGTAVIIATAADGGDGAVKAQCSVTVTDSILPFTDVQKDSWYYPYVKYAYQQELMNGVSAVLFSPLQTINRAMGVQVLYNYYNAEQERKKQEQQEAKALEEEKEAWYGGKRDNEPVSTRGSIGYSGSEGFSDVKSDAWYYKAVSWAAANDVVGGYPDGTFGPDRELTRETLLQILYNYSKKMGNDVSASDQLDGYSDKDKVSGWALTAVKWGIAEGIIGGKPDVKGGKKIDPLGIATRAEYATIMRNYVEEYVKK